jgi:hypothetical protein
MSSRRARLSGENLPTACAFKGCEEASKLHKCPRRCGELYCNEHYRTCQCPRSGEEEIGVGLEERFNSIGQAFLERQILILGKGELLAKLDSKEFGTILTALVETVTKAKDLTLDEDDSAILERFNDALVTCVQAQSDLFLLLQEEDVTSVITNDQVVNDGETVVLDAHCDWPVYADPHGVFRNRFNIEMIPVEIRSEVQEKLDKGTSLIKTTLKKKAKKLLGMGDEGIENYTFRVAPLEPRNLPIYHYDSFPIRLAHFACLADNRKLNDEVRLNCNDIFADAGQVNPSEQLFTTLNVVFL